MKTLEQTADLYVGNWKNFRCFCWGRGVDDIDNWCIYYTYHRDSGFVDQSNAKAIKKILQPYLEEGEDIYEEHHTHWAVGWIDGYSIRVYENGNITEVFTRFYEILKNLDNYPILDEEDYFNSEYEATLDNIVDAAWKLKKEYDLPECWNVEVYQYLSEHLPDSIENRDELMHVPRTFGGGFRQHDFVCEKNINKMVIDNDKELNILHEALIFMLDKENHYTDEEFIIVDRLLRRFVRNKITRILE